jgi:cytochrome c
MRRVLATAAITLLTLLPAPLRGQDLAESGRGLFAEKCSACHGLITEDPGGYSWDNLRRPVIMTPIGPNLTHVFGRPAGTVEGYSYSKAFRAAAPAIVWDAAALNRWITDSQAMIRGSAMFLKVPDADARAGIIAYLKRYAPYPGYDCKC